MRNEVYFSAFWFFFLWLCNDFFGIKFAGILKLISARSETVRATVCPGSSEPSEKILNIFASENEVYTIH